MTTTKYVLMTGMLLSIGFSAQAQEIDYLADGIYKVERNGVLKWGLYNSASKDRDTLTAPRFDSLYYRYWHGTDVAYYKLKIGDKWGIWDKNRNVLMPIQYDEVYYNHQAQPARIEARQGKLWGVFSPEGKELIPIQFDEIQSDGFNYKVRKGDKYGVYNANGGVEIPACYDNIYDHRFTEQSLVCLNQKWTVYRWARDGAKDPCVPATLYEGVGYFLDYFMVKKDGKYGLLDVSEKEILPLKYESLDVFYEPYLRTVIVQEKGKYGLLRIDSANNVTTEVPIEYDDIWVEKETFKIKVKLGDKIDYFYDNAPFFAMAYNDVHYFERINLFTIKSKGKWGLASDKKEVLIAPKYDKISIFDKNNYWVEKGGKWGLVDVRGKTKIPMQYVGYEYIEEWQVFFVAKAADKFGIASPRIGVILDAQYEEIIILSPKMYLVMKNGYWGVMGPNGRAWAEPKYFAFEWKPGSDKIILLDDMNNKYPIRIQ